MCGFYSSPPPHGSIIITLNTCLTQRSLDLIVGESWPHDGSAIIWVRLGIFSYFLCFLVLFSLIRGLYHNISKMPLDLKVCVYVCVYIHTLYTLYMCVWVYTIIYIYNSPYIYTYIWGERERERPNLKITYFISSV